MQQTLTKGNEKKKEFCFQGAKHSDFNNFDNKNKINYELVYESNFCSFASADRLTLQLNTFACIPKYAKLSVLPFLAQGTFGQDWQPPMADVLGYWCGFNFQTER